MIVDTVSVAKLLPNCAENSFIYKNSLSKIFHRLNLVIHSDLGDCFNLWQKFSPNKSLFDLWDFRYSWWQGYKYTPYFYTIYDSKKPLALLPLWYDPKDRRFEWFGSDWMEDNNFFVIDSIFIPILLKLIPKPFHLNAIESSLANKSDGIQFIEDDDKFVKDLSSYSTMQEFLESLKKKRRYNLKKAYQKIHEFNPKIEILSSNLINEFKNMKALSIHRFADMDESDLVVKKRVKTYEAIIKNSSIYKIHMIKVTVQSQLAAIDIIATYKDNYYTLKGANDLRHFSGVGNFMIFLEFEEAIKSGFKFFDCLQIDYGWKHKYYDRKKLYLYEKKL